MKETVAQMEPFIKIKIPSDQFFGRGGKENKWVRVGGIHPFCSLSTAVCWHGEGNHFRSTYLCI